MRADARFDICAIARMKASAARARARRLRDAVRHLMVAHGALEENRRPCGAPMSVPHAHALLELLAHERPMTVSELAAKLAIDRTNVSRLCARMQEAGELARDVHPDDRRARALRLTTRGKRRALAVDDSSARHFEQLDEALGDAFGGVVDALDRLCRAMTQTREEQ